MSSCEIITFNEGKPDHSVEFGNAWGGAAFIWTALFDQYLKDPDALFSSWLSDNSGTLWKLARRRDLPPFERAVHAATFDYAIVSRDNFQNFAAHLREFVACYGKKYAGNVCHLEAWAQFIGGCQAEAVGFVATSVTGSLWSEWDENTEEYLWYDLRTGTKHFEVYEFLGRDG